jgi:hypothetical protein
MRDRDGVSKDEVNWPYRIGQWLVALHFARQRAPWWRMIRALMSGTVPRSVWRERMRYGCYQCPVFNKERLTCRGAVPQVSRLGCDCFIPLLALTAEPYISSEGSGCWGRAALGGEFGWGAYKFPTRGARLVSPIRFLLGK